MVKNTANFTKWYEISSIDGFTMMGVAPPTPTPIKPYMDDALKIQ